MAVYKSGKKKNTEKEKGYYMTHRSEEVFVCKNCRREVRPENAGTGHRNHCPNCLSSVHLDTVPGDRDAECGGLMDPIAVWVRKDGEWALIHRCRLCGTLSSNRIAADDNPLKLMSIAMKPVANPPCPVERMQEMLKAMGIDYESESFGGNEVDGENH